jgi:DsbC/DsbD-like thiol-disulfide interchange protein
MAVLLGTSVAAADEPPRVWARLVADSARLEPGGDVRIGVLLEMEPGWHVYWKNPGDSGLATEVRWSLPSGFEASDLRWPTPIHFVQPGDLTAYGYEGSVLLASDVRVSTVPAGAAPKVAAEVSWLACRDVCVLGSASLEQSWPLPVAEAAFDRWQTELPGGYPPFSVSTTGGLAPGARKGELTIWLRWPEPPGDVDLFPDAGEALKVSNVKVQTRGSLTRVDLAVTVLGSGADRPDGLAAVVAAEAPARSRRSWKIAVPVSKS